MLRRFGLDGHGYPAVGITAGLGSTVMVRTRATVRCVHLRCIPLMPGAREKWHTKDQKCSYPEPAQVPLDEKSKARREKLGKGTRQISPVPSV